MNATQKARMKSRVAYGIENANASRFTRMTYQEAEKIAEKALEATGYRSLAAARRELDAKGIYYNF